MQGHALEIAGRDPSSPIGQDGVLFGERGENLLTLRSLLACS